MSSLVSSRRLANLVKESLQGSVLEWGRKRCRLASGVR